MVLKKKDNNPSALCGFPFISQLLLFLTSVVFFACPQMTPQDLNFVGYTYKNFAAVKGKHSSIGMQMFY